ncbi:hypothetical protein KR52_12950 [Synechococcus sp. KORDI-52]|uniref:hypothetical protein n=1 Tax=Synechococcus sp. KORDI-52 TaxID=585425 RepID=UPI0004E0469A|nr:hypothetical protein [Synechococcus sp. KORDI-52]AII50033.1 hypothetical protein KR52_12950 [Synechococcus sp. KORDI-52]
MITFLVFCSLLIPVNLWAAITPHMHSDLSMRILHGLCTLVLIPLLWTLWDQRRWLKPVPSLMLALFAVVMVVVNSWITAMGMGVEFGWLDHLFLALSEIALAVFFLTAPQETTA